MGISPFLRQPFSVETLSTMGWNGGSWPLKSSIANHPIQLSIFAIHLPLSQILPSKQHRNGEMIFQTMGFLFLLLPNLETSTGLSLTPRCLFNQWLVSPHTRLRQTSRKGGIFLVEEVSQPDMLPGLCWHVANLGDLYYSTTKKTHHLCSNEKCIVT
jgi:hypothetical protein